MKSLVIYDSMFGNTEKIALAVAEGMGSETKVIQAEKFDVTNLQDLQLLIIGSPVHGGRASEKLLAFFNTLEKNTLKSVKVGAFDTRFETNKQGLGLKTLMNIIGFAAGKITKTLIEKGGTQVIDPEGFIVTGKEGPLKEGEIERAKQWGRTIMQKAA